MKSNFSRVCTLASLTFLFTFLVQETFAQSKEKIEIRYKVDSVKIENSYHYNVTIKVKNGTGPYTYYLFLGEPWKGGEVVSEVQNVSATTYVFNSLPPSPNYHVGVKGATKNDVNWTYVKP